VSVALAQLTWLALMIHHHPPWELCDEAEQEVGLRQHQEVAMAQLTWPAWMMDHHPQSELCAETDQEVELRLHQQLQSHLAVAMLI
jgi:hypothetical protein